MRILFATMLCGITILLYCSAAIAQTSFDASGSGGGSIIPGYDSRTCGSGAPGGAIRYNSSSTCVEFCDGSSWTCPSSGGGCTVIWDTFTDLTNTAQSSLETGSIQYVSTSGCSSAAVSISGEGSPEYRICSNSDCSTVAHTWSTTAGSIETTEYIQSRLTSGASPGNTRTALVTLENAATEWSVTTANIPEYIAMSTATAAWPAANSTSVNKPAGTLEGDLMIAVLALGTSGINILGYTGWTELRDADNNNHRTAIYYKIAGSSEPSSYPFDFNDNDDRAAFIITIRNVDQTTPIDVNAANTGNDTNPVATSITTTVDDTLLVAINHHTWSGSHTPPTGYTERVDQSFAAGTMTITAATKLQSAAGATGNATFTHTNTDSWRTEHIAIRAP